MSLPDPFYDRDGIVIYHGDAREIVPMLEAGSIDLVLTDPPYQSLDVEVSHGTTTRLVSRDVFGGKRLAAKDGTAWFATLSPNDVLNLVGECQSLLKSTGALYLFADVKSGLELFPSLKPANVIVWDKGKLGMGFHWRRMHEWIAFCPGIEHTTRDKALGDIQRFAGVINKRHPTEKPVGLLQRIIINSSDPGAVVLDPFMGSGSTLFAAMATGRRAIGIDISERHCRTAVQRLQQKAMVLA